MQCQLLAVELLQCPGAVLHQVDVVAVQAITDDGDGLLSLEVTQDFHRLALREPGGLLVAGFLEQGDQRCLGGLSWEIDQVRSRHVVVTRGVKLCLRKREDAQSLFVRQAQVDVVEATHRCNLRRAQTLNTASTLLPQGPGPRPR